MEAVVTPGLHTGGAIRVSRRNEMSLHVRGLGTREQTVRERR